MILRRASILLVLATAFTSVWGQECPWGRRPSGKMFLEYLRQHASADKDPCIDDALFFLEPNEVSDSDIPMIISYIAHKRELNSGEKDRFIFHPSTTDYVYPANAILLRLGDRAVPALAEILASSTDPVAQKNSYWTWTTMFRDDPPKGVGELMAQAAKAKDPAGAARLRQVALQDAQSCEAKYRDRCMQKLGSEGPE